MDIVLALVATILLALASLTSSVVSIGGKGGAEYHSRSASEDLVVQSRPVSGFDEVELDTIGSLTITQGKTESLTVTAEPAVLAAITTEITGKKLTIGLRPGTTVVTTQPVTYHVTVKDLNAITLAGSGDATVPDLKTDHLTVQIKGSGGIKVDGLTADDLAVSLTGSGSGEASGRVTREVITISGSGAFVGGDLASGEATIRVSGSGSATLRVQHRLDARLSGSGGVRYVGNPTVYQTVTGSGRLQHIS